MFDNTIYHEIIKKHKTLTLEEERDLIYENRHDESRTRELLVLHNLSAAISIGRKYSTSRMDSEDDSIQRAMIGLYKASQTFKLDSGIRFITYATWKMVQHSNYINNDNLAQTKMNKLLSSLDAPINANNSKGEGDCHLIDLVDGLIDSEYKEERKCRDISLDEGVKDIILNEIDSLMNFSDRDKNIFKDWLFHCTNGDKTIKSISEEFKMSRQRIEQIVNDIRQILKPRIKNRYSNEEDIASIVGNDYRKTEHVERPRCDEVKKEEPTRDEKISDLRQRLKEKAMLANGISLPTNCDNNESSQPFKYEKGHVRIGTAMVMQSLTRTKSKNCSFKSHWRPESLDVRLQRLFSDERNLVKESISETNNSVICKRLMSISNCKMLNDNFYVENESNYYENDGDYEKENEGIAESMSMKIEESSISNGNHSDDEFETKDVELD